MDNEIEVAILTKSSKIKKHCVAGIEGKNYSWVRLVSNDETCDGALSDTNIQYEDQNFCNTLDVVRVPIISKCALKHQTENVLIDESKKWKKTGNISIRDLMKYHPPEIHGSLFGNYGHCISEDVISKTHHSLILVQVKDLILEFNQFGKLKAGFIYNSNRYTEMSVTDPYYKCNHEPKRINNAILVMSLPKTPHTDGWYYKLVAKIFEL